MKTTLLGWLVGYFLLLAMIGVKMNWAQALIGLFFALAILGTGVLYAWSESKKAN